jgi:hypothetical protein
MRGAAPACYLLLLFVSLSPAWAEAARTPRGAWTVSERELRAEQRSRAATTSICEGCMGRVGSREGASRLLAANLPRNVRGRSPALITRTWTPSDTLPLTSRAEAQIHRINRSIALQAERTQHQQQIQFELNQLRGELQRAYLFR